MKLPSDLSANDVRRVLEKAGFELCRQRGSHMMFRHESPRFTVVLPNHNPIRVGMLRKIIRDARMTVDEFLAYL